MQPKTQFIFQIALLIYKAKDHMELKCITELVPCRNTGKMQKIFYGWMNYNTCRDILIYLALFYNFFFLARQLSEIFFRYLISPTHLRRTKGKKRHQIYGCRVCIRCVVKNG